MFSSFELHKVSTVLSGRILYSADFSTPETSVTLVAEVTAGADAAGLGGSGLGFRLGPACASVTVMLIGGATSIPPVDCTAPEAAHVHRATLPPRAAA